MSLLYKPKEEQTTTFEVKTFSNDTLIVIDFYRDCGKFGTEESLAGFTLTADRLLQILQERDDITDEEL
jgi:aspartyl/asparaginyl-tRNA synthetase